MANASSGAWWREPTRAQYLTFGAAWLGWVLDAFDFTIFLIVMPEIAKEFGVSYTATAGSITLTLLVRLAGGYCAGLAADRWGRRLPLMISMVWFAVCDGAIAWAGTFYAVLALRTLFGFGMGAEWTAGTTLAMENWPARSRGIASGVLQGSWAVGYLIAGLVSGVVVPAYGWRALFLIAAAPALIAIPIRLWVPESAEWKEKKQTQGAVKAGFSPRVLLSMGWASALLAAGFGAYYALTGLYPTMLKTELHLSSPEVGHLVALFNIGMMIGAVAAGTLAARKSIPLAIAIPALCSIPFLPLYVGIWPAALGLGAALGGALGAGSCGTTPLLLTSLFPAEVRARAVGIVYHLGAFAAAFVPMGIAAFSESRGVALSTSLACAAAIFQIGVLALLVLRPREVRSAAQPGAEAAISPSSAHA